MSYRAPFNVFVFIYRMLGSEFEHAIFKRSDNQAWQGISGGGEYGETVIGAARREGFEEARIPTESVYHPLRSITSIPVSEYDAASDWPDDQYVIYGYPFAVNWSGSIVLSDEHTEVRWLRFGSAIELLTYQSSQVALSELHQRLLSDDMNDVASSGGIWTTLNPLSVVSASQNSVSPTSPQGLSII